MRSMIIGFIIVLIMAMILIPSLFVVLFDGKSLQNLSENSMEKVEQLEINQEKNVYVAVYRNKTKLVEKLPLEEYVRGVVAAEMPIDFELEALKAQAVAARTYIIKRIVDKDFSDVSDGAMVTDTVKHQVFYSDDELRSLWGLKYYDRISKLNKAINATNGQVITYKGRPINALYFSTSNGYTENSEDYWGKEVPYLRSVASPWDEASPKFSETMSIPFKTINSKLKINPAVLTAGGTDWLEVIEKTKGNRVKKVKVGDKVLTGREVREKLSLNSSSFTWKITKDQVIFQTLGYGHGVGMSQYGANGMAKEGKNFEEIIKHYYTDVELINISQWLKE